jgi:hypothetical protein
MHNNNLKLKKDIFITSIMVTIAASLTLTSNRITYAQLPNLVAQVSANTLVAANDIPVNEEILQRFITTADFLFDLSLNNQERSQFSNLLIQALQQGDSEKVQNLVNNLRFSEQFWQKSEAERENYRHTFLPVLVLELQKGAAKGNETDSWLLNLYTKKHPPLAKGNPPMTQQMVDLAIELNSFLISDLQGQRPPAQNPQKLVSDYSKLSPNDQQLFAQALARIGAFRQHWQQLPQEQHQQVRLALQRRAGSAGGQLPQPILLGLQSIQMRSIQQSWNAFMGNMTNIYGGTTWDSQRGQWITNPGLKTTIP